MSAVYCCQLNKSPELLNCWNFWQLTLYGTADQNSTIQPFNSLGNTQNIFEKLLSWEQTLYYLYPILSYLLRTSWVLPVHLAEESVSNSRWHLLAFSLVLFYIFKTKLKVFFHSFVKSSNRFKKFQVQKKKYSYKKIKKRLSISAELLLPSSWLSVLFVEDCL